MSSSGGNTSGLVPTPVGLSLTNTGDALVNAIAAQGELRLAQVYLPFGINVTALGCQVSAVGDAGCMLTPVIYGLTANGAPGALLHTGATVAGDSIGEHTAAAAFPLAAGWYWVGILPLLCPVTAPTLRGFDRVPGGMFGGLASFGSGEVRAVGWIQTGLAAPPNPFAGTVSGTPAASIVIST